MREMALQARADYFSFSSLGEHLLHSCIDVPIGNAAGSQLAGNTEASLAAGICALACEFKRVAGIVKVIQLAKPGDDLRNGVFICGSPLQVNSHFVDGMGATHEGAESRGVEFLAGGQLARLGRSSHERRIVGRRQGSKERRAQGASCSTSTQPTRDLPQSFRAACKIIGGGIRLWPTRGILFRV
jgi:hypothetical protein